MRALPGFTSHSRISVIEDGPGTHIVRRDLGTDPVPHLTAANLAGVRGTPITAEELAAQHSNTPASLACQAEGHPLTLPPKVPAW